MEGVLFLAVLLILAILIIPIVIVAGINSKLSNIKNELNAVKQYVQSIKQDIGNIHLVAPPLLHAEPEELSVTEKPPVPVKDELPEIEQEQQQEDPILQQDAPEAVLEISEPEITEEAINSTGLSDIPTIQEEAIPELADLPVPEPEPLETISGNATIPTPPKQPKKKTNFEQFIGEKLISIAGIAILVLGIFFSVKWAIDRDMISDAGKVMIGLVAGTILVAIAHRLAKNYRAFSSILAGGGLAVFYFSIFEAYQSYHLLSQTAAFIIMVMITLLAVILSIIYDKKELAIIAIIGGFTTPFFVSDGSGNYQVLFSYLLILNVGMFILAYFKKWNLVNIICYVFTMLIFAGWVMEDFDATKGHATGGLLFSSLFFVIFFGMNIIYNLRHGKKFGALEMTMLLSNSFIYLGFGLFFLNHIHQGSYQGMFTLSLSVFNFVFAYLFYRRDKTDKKLTYLLIGLVLTFLSLTGPLQLDGNYITLFWACELVILYWMGLKTGIDLLKNASILVLFLTGISLAMDWESCYFTVHINKLPLIFNKAFITGLVVISSLLIKRRLLRSDSDKYLLWGTLPVAIYRSFTEFVLLICLYLCGLFEVQYQSFHITLDSSFRNVMLWSYQYLAISLIIFYYLRRNITIPVKAAAACAAFLLLLYPIANYSITRFRDQGLLAADTSLYIWHYLLPLLALTCILLLIRYVRNTAKGQDFSYKAMAWGGTAIILFIISAEAVHAWVISAYQPGFAIGGIAARASKVALPIIWSICSLILMLAGMRGKQKIFRFISLSLFTLTIAKLFLFDISNMGQGGKIAAFIILGIILLAVSFMYQRIKGLFTDDSTQQEEGTQKDGAKEE